MREPTKCKRCKKIINSKSITGLCRRCYFYESNKKRNKILIKEHKCLSCGKKVKAKLIYHVRCDKCMETTKKKIIKLKKLKNNA